MAFALRKHMNLSLRILVIVVISFLSLSSYAGQDEFAAWLKISESDPKWSQLLQDASVMLIDHLLNLGQSKAGDIDLLSLKDEMLSVTWRITNATIAAGPDGTRPTAIYSVQDHLVIVSTKEWYNTDSNLRTYIALHEALGALGYHDENYGLSTAVTMLSTLSQTQNDNEANQIFQSQSLTPLLLNSNPLHNLNKTTSTPLYDRGGGVTGLGGGGDSRMISLKVFLLSVAPVAIKTSHIKNVTLQDLINVILNSEIESTDTEIKDTDVSQLLTMTKIIALGNHQIKIVAPKNAYFFYKKNLTQFMAQYLLDLETKIMVEVR